MMQSIQTMKLFTIFLLLISVTSKPLPIDDSKSLKMRELVIPAATDIIFAEDVEMTSAINKRDQDAGVGV